MSHEMTTAGTRMSRLVLLALLALTALSGCASSGPAASTSEKTKTPDPYSEYVWPPPPDEPRIQLSSILRARIDVEGDSTLQKVLLGARATTAYEALDRPFGVAIDGRGRILVTDIALHALLRFDRRGKALDVLGTKGSVALGQPMGVSIGPDERIYVADIGLKKVVSFDEAGKVVGVFGRAGELTNPVAAAVSPNGKELFVCDSMAHQIVVYSIKTGDKLRSFGGRGTEPGQFNFPSSIAFYNKTGELFVTDQMNARVQILDSAGSVVETFGQLGTGFGNFVRPKAVAVDDNGFVYVSDAAFGNIQIFDSELKLLTFVGSNGTGPGQFQIAGSVAVRGGEIAVVDQLNKRVQVFRYLRRD